MKRVTQRKLNATGEESCTICGTKTFLEQHHIDGRKILNANYAFNLANICSNCHTAIHKGQIVVNGILQTTDGPILDWYRRDL